MKPPATLVLGAALVMAQAEPGFEAVSIRPNTSGDSRMSMGVGGWIYVAATRQSVAYWWPLSTSASSRTDTVSPCWRRTALRVADGRHDHR
jgi:hypothetical protein